MKKTILLFIFLLPLFGSHAQTIYFPDAEFKTKLLSSSVTSDIAKDSEGNSIAIDANGNNEIEYSEALQVFELEIVYYDYGPNVTDIDGIQFFTNLQRLHLSNTKITTLDATPFQNLTDLNCFRNMQLNNLIVSGLQQLEALSVGGCNFSALDVSGLVNLKYFSCEFNNLNTLDFSGCFNLEHFICSGNNLQQLNFTGFHNLKYINCYNNNQLTTVNLSGNSELNGLYCYNNNNLNTIYMNETTFTGPDSGEAFIFSGNPNLELICTDAEAIDYISQLVENYGYTNCRVDVCSLNRQNESNQMFTLFPNPVSDYLNIVSDVDNPIKIITIFNVIGQKVLTKGETTLSKIDVSFLKAGNYFIKINSDKGITNAKFAKK